MLDLISALRRLVTIVLAVIGSAAASYPAGEGPLLPPLEEDAILQPPRGSQPSSARPSPSGGWAGFLRELSHEVIPDEYEVRENWGHKTEVFAGFNVREGELVPRISKRTKRVNHGAWRRFKVRLIHPDELRFEIRNTRLEAGGGLSCEVLVSARLRCTAQAEFWNLGVRTGSATVQSDVALKAVAEVRVVGRQADPEEDSFFTEVVYTPDVPDVRLRLTDLDVRRIGAVDGDVADALGDASRQVVQHFIEKQEPRVRKKLREEIESSDAELRLSLPRALFAADAPLDSDSAGGR